MFAILNKRKQRSSFDVYLLSSFYPPFSNSFLLKPSVSPFRLSFFFSCFSFISILLLFYLFLSITLPSFIHSFFPCENHTEDKPTVTSEKNLKNPAKRFLATLERSCLSLITKLKRPKRENPWRRSSSHSITRVHQAFNLPFINPRHPSSASNGLSPLA